jgi:hypothetical protein
MNESKPGQEKEVFPREKEEFTVAYRRWLVREIESKRLTILQSIERFDFKSTDPYALITSWRKRYAPEIDVSLPVMTEKERQKQELLLSRVKELEKQLEDAQMKNIALETLIDVAEEQLKIAIRKKAGARQ